MPTKVRRRRTLSIAAIAVAVVALLGGLVALAYYSPLMSVRSVDVIGAGRIDRNEILMRAQAPEGQPLLQVDTAIIANRLAAIPAVEKATVERSYPSTLVIEITERTPAVLIEKDGQIGVTDRLGVVYATFADRDALPREFANLPQMTVPNPGPKDPTTLAVLAVAAELPQWLSKRTSRIEATSPADISLVLGSGRRAVWGDAERTPDKAEALRQVLSVSGQTYNVSSPEFPAVS